MKKIFGVLIAVAMLALATLVLNGLVFRQVTWLAEENAFLRYELKQEIEAAKKENVTKTESAANGVIKQLLETQKTLLKELKEAETKNSAQIKSVGDELKKEITDTRKTLADKLETNLKNDEARLAELESKTFEPNKIYEKVKRKTVRVGGSSGFLLKDKVITAYHVVRARPGTMVNIVTYDGRNIDGVVKTIKPEWDLAVIKPVDLIDVESLLPKTDKPVVGEPVFVIGNPDMKNNSISTGVISGINRDIGEKPEVEFIQIDASTFFGNSGGPLLDREGKVMGVITNAVPSFSFSFAVPIEYVEKLLVQ